LIDKFWDSLYPELDDGDAEFRAAPLEWMGSKLDVPAKNVALSRDGYHYLQFRESRTVPTEEQAKASKDQKTARDAALKDKKLPPEAFDKSFDETPKAFYAENEKSLDACLAGLASLDELCRDKFGDAAPTYEKLKNSLDEVRRAVH